jgi:DNA-binding MarR family transcriptional regulator
MTTDLRVLAGLDRVIHEPGRLMIMTVLYANAEADFRYLQKEWRFTQGNLSSHLAKLEAAGYVQLVKSFKEKYPLTVCSLTKKGRDAFEQYARKLKYISGAADGSKSSGS